MRKLVISLCRVRLPAKGRHLSFSFTCGKPSQVHKQKHMSFVTTAKPLQSPPRQKVAKEEIITACANDLSTLFGGDKTRTVEVARALSHAARKELSEIREKMGKPCVREPPKRHLKLHAFAQGIPFIGFGIMDNAILIVAGDQIDMHMGVTLGISTLCAAAIGNIISDVVGVGFGTLIEDFCTNRLKIPLAPLTNAQRKLRSVRFAGQSGCAVGITIGCVIGMFPLMFIDTDEIQKMKSDARIEEGKVTNNSPVGN